MNTRESKQVSTRKIHVNLPEEIHQKLRVRCALEDVTMQDYVAMLIEESVEGVSVVLDRKHASKGRSR